MRPGESGSPWRQRRCPGRGRREGLPAASPPVRAQSPLHPRLLRLGRPPSQAPISTPGCPGRARSPPSVSRASSGRRRAAMASSAAPLSSVPALRKRALPRRARRRPRGGRARRGGRRGGPGPTAAYGEEAPLTGGAPDWVPPNAASCRLAARPGGRHPRCTLPHRVLVWVTARSPRDRPGGHQVPPPPCPAEQPRPREPAGTRPTSWVGTVHPNQSQTPARAPAACCPGRGSPPSTDDVPSALHLGGRGESAALFQGRETLVGRNSVAHVPGSPGATAGWGPHLSLSSCPGASISRERDREGGCGGRDKEGQKRNKPFPLG